MKRAIVLLLFAVLAACGDSTGPQPDPIPTDLLPNEGILRFTLSSNCPTLTIAFGVDQFLFGPETLAPGQSFDYRLGAGPHITSGKTFPVATQTFPAENTIVIAKERVVRVLSCS